MVLSILAVIALLLSVLALFPKASSYPLVTVAVILLAIGLALPLFGVR